MEKLIQTDKEYKDALAVVESLMDAQEGTEDMDRLEYWAKLVEFYEDEYFPIPKPSPIEAILYALERLGLTRKDLEPFIGNKSRVSEVLSGKRPLTLEMIRRLHVALGIPLDTLAQEMASDSEELDWGKFPVRDMVKRGWIEAASCAEAIQAELRSWLGKAGLHAGRLAHCPRSSTRMGTRGDAYGILAWVAQVQLLSSVQVVSGRYDTGRLTAEFFRGLYALSVSENGPAMVREYLSGFGIHLVVLPHLPKTYLDGAAMLTSEGNAIVGLSLRHDRLDNFWFTLGHEIAHLVHGHIEPGGFVVDDMDARSQDEKEQEADALASNMAIPVGIWEATLTSERASLGFVLRTAKALGIHPAIVAGRVRNETHNFKQFSKIVGPGKVRAMFPEWGN